MLSEQRERPMWGDREFGNGVKDQRGRSGGLIDKGLRVVSVVQKEFGNNPGSEPVTDKSLSLGL
jgi:hypothetical protein